MTINHIPDDHNTSTGSTAAQIRWGFANVWETIAKTGRRILPTAVLGGLLLALLGVLIRSAWVMDDAYITFRTIDNFVSGYGLTFNVAERVQVYTHPLWMFLMTLVYLLTDEIYYTSIITSLLVTLLAAAIVVFRLAANHIAAGLALVCLIASKPFVDFSTSGLENPLSHLILVLFLLLHFRSSDSNRKLFVMALLAALAMLNRMDTILLYLPILVYYLLRSPTRSSVAALCLGFIPFAVWECFSLFYYGVPFPNTAYAKLSTGIPHLELISQGILYLKSSAIRSPITTLAIAAALWYGAYTRSLRMIAPALGILLYLTYVILIGGCFMDGRFLTVPLVLAVAILAQYHFRLALTRNTVVALTVLLVGLGWPHSPVRVGTDYGTGDERQYSWHGITDERAGYYQYTGLLVQRPGKIPPNHVWADDGRAARTEGASVVHRSGIGMFGYFAGPQVHLLDKHALSDPLLSRLPFMTPQKWRIGHFWRPLPAGYLASLESGQNRIVDSSLAQYYGKLALLTKGKLTDAQRIRDIWNFNMSRYNYLLHDYLQRPRQVAYEDFCQPRSRGTPYHSAECILLLEPGLCVDLSSRLLSTQLEISVNHNDDYLLQFRADTTVLAELTITSNPIPEYGLRVDTITIPEPAVNGDCDNILILPRAGDRTYTVGHLRTL